MMLKQRACVKGAAAAAGMKNGRLQRPFLHEGQGMRHLFQRCFRCLMCRPARSFGPVV